MEAKKRSNLPSLDRCMCCLEDGALKDLWADYYDGDERENYGEMIIKCFALSLQQSVDHIEQICESCINKLRNACEFRNDIMSAHQIICQYFSDETNGNESMKQEIKVENVSINNEVNIKVEDVENDQFEYYTLIEECQEEIQDQTENEQEEMEQENDEHEEVEEYTDEEYHQDQEGSDEGPQYLEEADNTEDDQGVEYLDIQYLDDDNATASTAAPEGPKRKWPKKKKKGERLKSYRNYTDDDLRNCIEAVKNNELTRSEASLFYGVPTKTLYGKLKAELMKQNSPASDPTNEDEAAKIQKQQKHTNFLTEIKTILTYTNATPIKTKSGRYYCAYCHMSIENADDLRLHTRTDHAEERVKSVDAFMRPHWYNEVLKLDIENLTCTECGCTISTWNDMFKHLKQVHEVELDEAYTKVIPYVLKDVLHCALCGEKYTHFHLLDGHMNAHYNNYICGECGDSFLSETRLKKHEETHNVGRYPCHLCNKVFALEKYRSKHFNGVHSELQKFKCRYCPEKFRAEYSRHLHVTEKHKEKVKIISCEICGRTFDWRPYYSKHMRLKHSKKEKKHKCTICGKMFFMKHELKNHEDWHLGVSGTVCAICDKKFSSKQYLRKHYQTHKDVVVIVDK